MRRFRVRDLMINVLPEEGVLRADCCQVRTAGFTLVLNPPCGPCTWGETCVPCSFNPCTGGVTPLGPGCHPAVSRITKDHVVLPRGSPEELAILRDELRQALAQVEAQERVQSEAMRPQTLDEATALEEKLEGALEEVRARKEELREGAEDQG